jgi:hypothetical protein
MRIHYIEYLYILYVENVLKIFISNKKITLSPPFPIIRKDWKNKQKKIRKRRDYRIQFY